MQKIRKMLNRMNVISLILAIIFALCTQIGRSFIRHDSWELLIGKRAAVYLFLLMIFYFFLLRVFYELVDRRTDNYTKKIIKTEKTASKVHSKGKYSIWIGLILIFLIGWLPYLILFYPGSIPPDTSSQLSQFFGRTQWSDHHPVFSSVLMGSCVQMGMLLKNANLGIFIYTLLQTITTAFACTYMIITMKKYNAPKGMLLGTIFYFAVFPLWGLTVQTVVKDTLFNAIVMIFVVFLFDQMGDINAFLLDNKKLFIFVLLMVFMALLRKNGIYIAYITLFSAMLLYRKYYKKFLLLLISMIVFYSAYSNVLLSSMGVTKGSVKEALSIPFQQTARYLQEYPEDITDSEKEVLNQVLDVEKITENYIPWLSDPVKNTFRSNAGKEELKKYFKIWFNMFLRHPDVYIQATLHNSFGYYYPFAPVEGGYGSVMIQMEDNMEDLDIHFSVKDMNSYRERLYHGTYSFLDSRWIHWLVCPGFYTWSLLLITGYILIKKQYKLLLIMIPSYTIVLTCIASPVNAYVRYALPMISVTPIVYLLVLMINNGKEDIN